MSTLSASFVTVAVSLTASSSLFVDNHATTSTPSPSSLILRRQLCGLPCRLPPLPRRRGCHRHLSSLWFFPSSARHRRLSSLWFFPSLARHRRHPQDPALPLQISSLFLTSTVQPLLLAVRLLSLTEEDVAAASLLSGSFLRRLAIAAIPKIQHCRCRSPPSSSPPPSSRRFLLFSSDASSPSSTFSFSFSDDLCASSSSAFRHCRLLVFHPHPVHP